MVRRTGTDREFRFGTLIDWFISGKPDSTANLDAEVDEDALESGLAFWVTMSAKQTPMKSQDKHTSAIGEKTQRNGGSVRLCSCPPTGNDDPSQ